MKVVVVMGNLTPPVVKNLKDGYGSIEVLYQFSTLTQASSTLVKKPVDVDTFIFSDAGITDSVGNAEDKSLKIMQVLTEFKSLFVGETSDFFKCNTVIFLDSLEGGDLKKYVDFIMKDIPVDYQYYPYNKAVDISKYILHDLSSQTDQTKIYKNVVRSKRVGKDFVDYQISVEQDGREIIKIIEPNPRATSYDNYHRRVNEVSKSKAQINISLSEDNVLEGLSLPEYDTAEVERLTPPTTKDSTLTDMFVVTGKEKTGTSTTALALARSAHLGGQKVLLIDGSRNLGLSYLGEVMVNQPLILIPVQSLVKNLREVTPKLKGIVENKQVTLLVNTLDYARQMDYTSLTQVNMYAIIIDHLNFYDVVIIDINEEEFPYYKPMLDGFKPQYIVTFSRNLPSLVETGTYVKSYLAERDNPLIIPVDNYQHMKGLPILNNATMDMFLKRMYPADVKVLATLLIKDINTVGGSLYHAVKAYKGREGG